MEKHRARDSSLTRSVTFRIANEDDAALSRLIKATGMSQSEVLASAVKLGLPLVVGDELRKAEERKRTLQGISGSGRC